jgi:hypothetical protein
MVDRKNVDLPEVASSSLPAINGNESAVRLENESDISPIMNAPLYGSTKRKIPRNFFSPAFVTGAFGLSSLLLDLLAIV